MNKRRDCALAASRYVNARSPRHRNITVHSLRHRNVTAHVHIRRESIASRTATTVVPMRNRLVLEQMSMSSADG